MSKQYLVTGGTGFIGSALVRKLLATGHQVRVLDNNSRGTDASLQGLKKGLEIVHGDIQNPAVVKEATSGVDAVLHLAAVNGTKNFYNHPTRVLNVAVRGMLNVLDACESEGVRELLVVSTSEVYQTPPVIPTPETVPLVVPDPHNPRYSYGSGKIISEMLTLHATPDAYDKLIIVRPHNVYGPAMGWEHVIPEIAGRILDIAQRQESNSIKLPIQGSGTETRAFIYIDDFIEGLLTAFNLGTSRQIYHVGTQNEISISLLCKKIGENLGIKITPVAGTLTPGSTLRRCPDITKLRALGFSAKVSLDEGLKSTLSWYKENPWRPEQSPPSLNPARS